MFATFTNVQKDAVPIQIEAEWFQLTYDELRVAPDGDTIAFFDRELDVWRTRDDDNRSWSDIIISEGV